MDQQKTPLSRTLTALAKSQAQDNTAKIGLRLPGHVTAVSGAIVTVSFDAGIPVQQMSMAVATSKYCRVPIQPGDEGFATTADAYLGAVTGLGGGAANLTQRGNLAALVWVPLGNTGWASVDPTATHLESANGEFTVDVSNTGIKMAYNGTVLLEVNSSSQVLINSRVFLNHDHTAGTYVAGTTAVTGDSGPVV